MHSVSAILYIGIMFLCLTFVTCCIIDALSFGHTVYRNHVLLLDKITKK